MFLNIFNEISNAFNKPSKYADGGNLGGKKYYLTGYSAMASEDSYEEGELKQVSDWEVRDSKVFNTKEQLVEYINKHIIYKDYDVADFDWETGKGENIQTGVLCAYDDYNGYFPADKSEIEQWKKGKKKLYNVHYFIYVTAAIPTEYAKGGELKHFVGKFTESQLKKGEDKIAIEKAKKETGLKYIESKIIKKNGKPYLMEVYLTNMFSEGGGVAKGWTDAEKSDLEAQFAKGGGVGDERGWWSIEIEEDDNDENSRNEEVARLIREGYTSGYYPTWTLKTTIDIGDNQEHIASLVEQGYTSGELINEQYAKGGGMGETKYAKYKIRKDIVQNGEAVPVGDGYVSSGVYEGRYRDEDTFEIKHNGVWKVAESIDWEIAEDKYANGGGVAKGWTDAEKSDMEAQFGEGGKMRWWSVTLKMPNGEIANEYVVAGNRNDAIYHGGLTDSAREGGKVLSVKFQGVEEYAKGGGVRDIPYGVYFSLEDYKNFKNGNVNIGDEISMALSPSYHTISKITSIDKKGKHYGIQTKEGANYQINWDLGEFLEYQNKRIKDGQAHNSWAFYKFIPKDKYAKGGSVKKYTNEFKEVADDGQTQYYVRDWGHIYMDDDKKIDMAVVAEIQDLGAVSESEYPSGGQYFLRITAVPYPKFIARKHIKEANSENNSISSDSLVNVVNYMGGINYNPQNEYAFKTQKDALEYLMSKELNDRISAEGSMSGFVMDKAYNRIGQTNWDMVYYMIGETDRFAKGGNVRKKRLTDKYKYVPNYMVQEVEVERNGKTTAIDGSDVLDGFYVKKGVKYAKGGGIKKTKKAYIELLNEIGVPEHDHPENGGRVSWAYIDKYGEWLAKNDPIAFNVGYSEWSRG